LLPNATYTLFLRGLRDSQSRVVPWSTSSFTTETLSGDQPSAPQRLNEPGGSPSAALQASDLSNSTRAAQAEEKKPAAKQQTPTKKRAAESEKSKAAAEADEFEDWIPSAQHRHGQWRLLGLKNEPRLKGSLEPAPLQRAAAKATALSGRVVRLNGRPIEGVIVSAGPATARTDRLGRFLLTNLAEGVQELTVNGGGVRSGGRRYTTHFIQVDLAANQTTMMPPIYLARIDPASEVSIPSPTPREVVLTHPNIPGLELHIPKGAVLRTRDGKVITQLSITPLPVDRAPFAVPDGFPVYFTVQPAGAFVDNSATGSTAGIRVIYPNYIDAEPGARVAFYNYDPTAAGWQVYGHGTVSSDGKRVVPDDGVVQHNLMAFGYGLENVGNAPATGPAPGGCAEAGDPVDCATGLFVHRSTDLFLSDTLPIQIDRTYRSNDTKSRDFGIGANHNFALFLSNPTGDPLGLLQSVDLILPDGARINFQRLPGVEIFRHFSSPTAFQGATLRYDIASDRWQIILRDKTIYAFSDHAPNVLMGIRDRYGNTINITRTIGGGPISRISSPNGRYFDFSYNASKRITQITDNIGRRVKYEYDSQGRLWRVTDPANRIEQYTYDNAHRMTSVIDKRGNTMVTNAYDANGRVVNQTLADGAEWKFAYTVSGTGKVQRTRITNARGYDTLLIFNSSGYVTQVTYAVGESVQQTYTYERAAVSQFITRITDPLNRVTALTYDHMGNVSTITRLAGAAEAVTDTRTYEPVFGNLTSYTDPLNHRTQLRYDVSGNLVGIADVLGHGSSGSYDANGRLISLTNALGKTTQITYDQGDVAQVSDPLNRTVSFITDAAGRVISVTDPLGNRERFEFDSLNRVLQTIDALGGRTTSTYDANGNLQTVRDARNVGVHTFTYDARNRVKTYTDPLGNSETYSYDEVGNLVELIDRKNQVTSYTYDALNRLKTTTYADGSHTTISWDAVNRPVLLADSASGTLAFHYDRLDRLIREVSPQGEVSYLYDAAGNRKQLTVSGHAPVTYDYDAAGRLTQIAQGGSTVNLGYDAANKRTSVTLPNGINGTYTFDDANQLLSITYSLGAALLGDLSYSYDHSGRRTGTSGSLSKLRMPATVATATYDPANRLTSWGASSLSYDANGNLSGIDATTFGWNAREQLIATSSGASTFAYDVLGRRTSRTVSGATDQYLHDGLTPVTFNDDFLLSGRGLDDVYAQVAASGTMSYLSDALGSTRLLTDASGATTANYTYSPYGEVAKSGSDDTPFQFTGRDNDGAANLQFNRARYYSPQLGRFISEDPLGLAGGVNQYAYAGNPLSYTDPLGLFLTTVDATCAFAPDLCGEIFGQMFENYGDLSSDKCVAQASYQIASGFRGVGMAASMLPLFRLGSRLWTIHGAQNPIAQNMRTTAGLQTNRGRIFAGGRADLSRAQRGMMLPDEIPFRLGTLHAEHTVLVGAAMLRETPQFLAATRTFCPQCRAIIRATGGRLTSDVTAIWP
jgi:RHS repeat-associated protein